ncbi:unnamed protein product, partial [Iphiclides podalirius]
MKTAPDDPKSGTGGRCHRTDPPDDTNRRARTCARICPPNCLYLLNPCSPLAAWVEGIEDKPRAAAPVSVPNEENAKIAEKLVLVDARVRVKTLAERIKLSVGTIQTILHEHIHRVLRMFKALQKQVGVEGLRGFFGAL